MARDRWRARVGLDYTTPVGSRRAEAGDTVDDLPADAVGWLLEQHLIEPAPPAQRKAGR